MIIVHTISNL